MCKRIFYILLKPKTFCSNSEYRMYITNSQKWKKTFNKNILNHDLQRTTTLRPIIIHHFWMWFYHASNNNTSELNPFYHSATLSQKKNMGNEISFFALFKSMMFPFLFGRNKQSLRLHINLLRTRQRFTFFCWLKIKLKSYFSSVRSFV